MALTRTVPEPDLRHLKIMTDDVGMAQHAMYAIPDRRHGYCTDDNARALIVALWHLELHSDPEDWPLISTYLAFLLHAYNENHRRFRNFMSYSREWLEEVGSEDSHARALMALGIGAAVIHHESTCSLCCRLFCQALPIVEDFTSPRSWALTIIGIDSYLKRFPDDAAAQRMLGLLASRLMRGFAANASRDWPWLENTLTWGNAKIPHALMLAGARLNLPRMTATAGRALRWLLDIQTADAGHLTIIGNQGWYHRRGDRAVFDQQPIEAMDLALAGGAAYDLTHDQTWLLDIRRCLDWFLGRNDLGLPLYDPATGGSCDGLNSTGLNANQGAESTLAWLSTLLLVHDLQAHGALDFSLRQESPIELDSRVI